MTHELTAVESKQELELVVAKAFCERHCRDNGTPCVVMGSLKEPAPDVLIRVGDAEVALELTQYREQGLHNQLNRQDRELKLAMSLRFGQIGRHRLPRCTPRLRYRVRSGRPDDYLVPPKHRWPPFADELISLLRSHHKPRGNVSTTRTTFQPETRPAGYADGDGIREYVAGEKYPTLTEYCSGVDLVWHPRHGIGLPASSMNARYGKTDFAEISRLVKSKLSRLATYRKSVPGKPIWLLVYAEGRTPTSRLIGKGQGAAVTGYLREMLTDRQPNFDAVWWASETSAGNGAEVSRII